MKILLAIDDASGSHHALDRLAELTPREGREVLVLHVYHPQSLEAALVGSVGFVAAVDEAGASHARQVLVRACDRLERQGIHAEPLAREGVTVDSILEVAREKQVDLIVLGSHHASAIARMLFGSVTESLAAHAPVPLLIVP
ncbi:MAG TPA: universal stress protein [Oscillatoriaceae cyanobacterium]